MISRAWGMFWVVALIWGSSFLLISFGVAEMSPSQVVFIRCAVAAVGLNAVLLLRGKRLPTLTERFTWRNMIVIGIFNAVVPYLLLGIGQQTIPSNVTSVLQSTTALFAMVISHFMMQDERMTFRKVAGISLGFMGVVVLAFRTAPNSASGQAANLLGALCILGASFSYALTTAYSRRATQGKIEPIVIAATSFLVAAVVSFGVMLLEPVFGGRAATPLTDISSGGVFAVLMLGFLNTFVAYLFYYYIVHELGASRATMVTYVVPLIGLILGTWVRNEAIDAILIFGAVLIFAGIAVANLNLRRIMRSMRTRFVTS